MWFGCPRNSRTKCGNVLRSGSRKWSKLELLDKIATEKDAVAVEELVEFLQKVEHPALAMASVLGE